MGQNHTDVKRREEKTGIFGTAGSDPPRFPLSGLSGLSDLSDRAMLTRKRSSATVNDPAWKIKTGNFKLTCPTDLQIAKREEMLIFLINGCDPAFFYYAPAASRKMSA